MRRVVVAGATGRLGTPVAAGIEAADDMTLVARVAPSLGCTLDQVRGPYDTLVDVSVGEAAPGNAAAAFAAGADVVLGATGLSGDQLDDLGSAAATAGRRVFYAPNFAVGAVLAMQFAARAATHFEQAEIVEEHADTKRDRPSGTALRTADLIESAGRARPPIHSLRLPGIVANQSVVFGALGQTLEIRHVTTSRDAFVPGVLLAIRRVHELPLGLTVGLERLL